MRCSSYHEGYSVFHCFALFLLDDLCDIIDDIDHRELALELDDSLLDCQFVHHISIFKDFNREVRVVQLRHAYLCFLFILQGTVRFLLVVDLVPFHLLLNDRAPQIVLRFELLTFFFVSILLLFQEKGLGVALFVSRTLTDFLERSNFVVFKHLFVGFEVFFADFSSLKVKRCDDDSSIDAI